MAKVDELIFVQNRDPRAEMWNGKRLGTEGVIKELGFQEAFVNTEFPSKSGINTADFDQIFSFNLTNAIEERA